MPILYSDVDKDKWFYSTNFVRWRHRYRGSRESYKFNYEISSFLYEIRRVFAKNLANIEELESNVQSLMLGVDLDATIKTNSKFVDYDTGDGNPPSQRRFRYRGHIPYRIQVDYWGRLVDGGSPPVDGESAPYNIPVDYNNPDKDYRGRDI